MSIRGLAAGALALALTACQTPSQIPTPQEDQAAPSPTAKDVLGNSPYAPKKGALNCAQSPTTGKQICTLQSLEH